MSESDDRGAIREARLSMDLEDCLQENRAPDLAQRVVERALAGHVPGREGFGRESFGRQGFGSGTRWLAAALVLLGLAVVPSIYLLREDRSGERSADDGGRAPQRQDPDPAVVEPADRAELLQLLGQAEGLQARVVGAWGVPFGVAGDPPVDFVQLFGAEARSDLGWHRGQVATEGTTLAGLLAGFDQQGQADVRFEASLRTIELQVLLPKGRIVRMWADLPGGTRHESADGLVADGRRGVRLRAGAVAAIADGPELRSNWEFVDELVTATLCLDRGIVHGNVLGGDFGRTAATKMLEAARAATQLRFHDVTAEQLREIADGGLARYLDLRWCTGVGGKALMAAAREFGAVETLVVHGRMGSDPFGDAPMPSVVGLVVCATQEDPWGPLRAPEARFIGRTAAKPVLRAFPNLKVARLPNGLLDDADLEALPPSLEELYLRFRFADGGRRVGTAGLAAVARLPNLRRLEIGNLRNGLNPKATDPDLDVLEALSGASNLEYLDLDRWFDRVAPGVTRVQPDDPDRRRRLLTKLATLPHLRFLSLRNNPELLPEDVAALRTAPQIEFLDLSGCAGLASPSVLGQRDVDEHPVPVASPMPPISKALRGILAESVAARGAVRGAVRVAVVVDANGDPESVVVVHAVHPELVRVATAAVKQWRFKPATKDGQAVAVRFEFPLHMR